MNRKLAVVVGREYQKTGEALILRMDPKMRSYLYKLSWGRFMSNIRNSRSIVAHEIITILFDFSIVPTLAEIFNFLNKDFEEESLDLLRFWPSWSSQSPLDSFLFSRCYADARDRALWHSVWQRFSCNCFCPFFWNIIMFYCLHWKAVLVVIFYMS